MTEGFEDEVRAFQVKTMARQTVVLKESAQRVVGEAQTVTGEGGNMRIDTGFLRASGQASVDEITATPVARPVDWAEQSSSEDPTQRDVALVLSGIQLGQTFYFVYAANYARAREAKDGFVKLAAQRWTSVVSQVVSEISRT